MDLEYLGTRALGPGDNSHYHKWIKHAAEAYGGIAYEAMGTYMGIHLAKSFVASDGDPEPLGRELIEKLAKEIDMQKPKEKPIIIEQTTDPEPTESIGNRKYISNVDDETGHPAEMAVLAWLQGMLGPEVVKHWPYGKYDVDIAVVVGKPYFIDVERRSGPFDGPIWPGHLSTIHVPLRKRKMITTRVPFFYYVVNRSLTRALVLRGTDILASDVVTVKGNYESSKPEDYFDVPLDKIVKYIDL